MISFSDINSGNATRILNLAKRLSDEIEVEIIFDGSRNSYIPKDFSNLKILFTPYLKNLYLTLSNGIFYKLFKFMKKYDVVHCFKPLPTSFIPSYMISKFKNSKLIVDFDDLESKNGFAKFDPFFLRDILHVFQFIFIKNADFITVATPYLGNIAKIFNENIYLIPNGADVETFRPNRNDELRDIYGTPLIVYVGHLFKSCDLDIVIQAMPHVIDQISVKLLVVGDGLRKSEYLSLAKKLKVKKNVIFVGYKPRELIPKFISAADITVLPMRDNLINQMRSPIKLGEYLASGKAVIVSNVGIAKRIIKNNFNGVLTLNRPHNFANSIIKLLKNKKLRKKIEKNARKTAEEKLDWKIMAKKLENIYKTLL
jgi:glycosyltransferase involved in cell wall biosynthesis